MKDVVDCTNFKGDYAELVELISLVDISNFCCEFMIFISHLKCSSYHSHNTWSFHKFMAFILWNERLRFTSVS